MSNLRNKGKVGLRKSRILVDSSPSDSSASSESEDESAQIVGRAETRRKTKEATASLQVLELSDEDDGPRIGAVVTASPDDLDSIDSKLLFRSSPPPATPSSSRSIAGPSRTPRVLAANSRPTTSVQKPGSSIIQSQGITPTRMRKNIRKQYSALIEKCQEFEGKEGFDEGMETVMNDNFGRGKQLFEEIGGGPGDMFLAFLHTRICSGMLKFKTINIGNNTSAFKVDVFLHSLMEKCLTSKGEYTPRQAVKCISSSATDCCKTLNHITALIGSFDRQTLHGAKDKDKEKKQRLPSRKRQFDDTLAKSTQHEVVKFNSERAPKASQKSFSKEILKVLHTCCEAPGKKAINLFEFTMDKNSFASTIESLFFVAFLVSDGDVCLYREDNQPNHDYTISIKPDKPPEKNLLKDAARRKKKKGKRDSSGRSQFILSFSMRRWKELSGMATGADIITEHKRKINIEDGDDDN